MCDRVQSFSQISYNFRHIVGQVSKIIVHLVCEENTKFGTLVDLTRFNKIAIQGTPQMAVD